MITKCVDVFSKQVVFVVDINDCSSNPCENNGLCTDDVNRYTCTCPAGYTGTDCETSMYVTNICL